MIFIILFLARKKNTCSFCRLQIKPGKKKFYLIYCYLQPLQERDSVEREREREIFRRDPIEFPSGEGRSAGERKRERERFAGEILQRFCRERLSGEKNKEREDRERGGRGRGQTFGIPKKEEEINFSYNKRQVDFFFCGISL